MTKSHADRLLTIWDEIDKAVDFIDCSYHATSGGAPFASAGDPGDGIRAVLDAAMKILRP